MLYLIMYQIFMFISLLLLFPIWKVKMYFISFSPLPLWCFFHFHPLPSSPVPACQRPLLRISLHLFIHDVICTTIRCVSVCLFAVAGCVLSVSFSHNDKTFAWLTTARTTMNDNNSSTAMKTTTAAVWMCGSLTWWMLRTS